MFEIHIPDNSTVMFNTVCFILTKLYKIRNNQGGHNYS